MKLFLLTLLTSTLAFAAIPNKKSAAKDPCNVAQMKAIEISLLTENINNVNTTSTEAGGPYQRKSLDCKKGECSVISENKTVRKYMPDHDDADIDGYVEFPAIDVKNEMSALMKASAELDAAKIRCN